MWRTFSVVALGLAICSDSSNEAVRCEAQEESEAIEPSNSLLQRQIVSSKLSGVVNSPAFNGATSTANTSGRAELHLLETCPLEKFDASLAKLLQAGLLEASKISHLAPRGQFLAMAEQQRCGPVGPQWQMSEKPLIINLGEGTTGTSYLAELMRSLGYDVCHYCDGLGYNGNHSGSTSVVDQFDMIADVPVPYVSWELIQSHPKAVFIMTMRDPVSWQDHRVRDHSPRGQQWGGDPEYFYQAVPCGRSKHDLSSDVVPQTYVAYSAWVACILPPERLLMTNFFTAGSTDEEFLDVLVPFLESHGLQKPDWKSRTASTRANLASIRACKHPPCNY